MTFDLAQAEELARLVDQSDVVFGLTHNYTGYPLVRQAREMILGGELGEIQAIRAFYIQGWLRSRLEQDDQKQAAWRTDPKKSGAAGCFGDIATHAYNLGRYMTGLIPDQVSCHLKRKTGLTTAACAGEGHQAVVRDEPPDLHHRLLSTDEASELQRQVVGEFLRRW